MTERAVVLLSGGIDSATCAAIARSQGFELFAMSFGYGQRHEVELAAARRVAAAVGVREHRIVAIDLRAFGGSSLTSEQAVPKDRLHGQMEQGIPCTYVPARNTIFLSYALAWAETLDCRDIFIGVNAVDYSGYPDCRPEYIEAYQAMAALATRAGVEGNPTRIHTPLADLTKADIIRKGAALDLDYGLTHSCYDPTSQGLACGHCDSCLIRRKGFAEAGVGDPTVYA